MMFNKLMKVFGTNKNEIIPVKTNNTAVQKLNKVADVLPAADVLSFVDNLYGGVDYEFLR